MEVRCSNCATEYEFDDALVSARGTSVKCTNCGHQFRVHPAASSVVGAETWVVRDAHGKETTFTSLRDLQQGIVKGQLDPRHELSHSGKPFRPLEDIYELQTFFSAARQRPLNRQAPRTLLGVGRDPQPPQPPRPSDALVNRGGDAQFNRVSTPPPRKRVELPDRETPVAGIPALKSQPGGFGAFASADAKSGFDSGSRSVPVARQHMSSRPATSVDRASASAAAAEVPWQHLQGLRSDSDDSELRPGGGSGLRWVALVVVVGALGLIGATVGRDYFLGFIRPEQARPEVDQRVPALLEQARLALTRGDFENAHAELAKASLLGEADPDVAAALARLEVAQAEPLWLQLRVGTALDAARAAATEKLAAAEQLAPRRKKASPAELATEAAAVEARAVEKKQLELAFQERINKARGAVAAAVQRAPAALDVVRAHVDELRMEGQVGQARKLVGALSAEASNPDNAYSLGALDVAEGESGYPSAIDRLRVATRTEEGLGKARALLIYVLAQSGDATSARAEFDKLERLAPRHRALGSLRSLVELSTARVAAAAPAVEAPVVKRPVPPAPKPAAPAGGDIQSQLTQAATLHREGDLNGAERAYQNVLARSSTNVTALSGLGDIARQRHATATAAAFYDQALKNDRNHVPTLMARADMYWAAGNRILGVALYRRALAQVGPSTALGQRAMARIEEFDKQVQAPDAPAASAPTEVAPSSPTAPAGESGNDVAPKQGADEPGSAEPVPAAPPPAPAAPPKASVPAPLPTPTPSVPPGGVQADPDPSRGGSANAP
jgi:predicted Zn finger-like uncharacterized protein